jgi:hypothetical protein
LIENFSKTEEFLKMFTEFLKIKIEKS